MQSGRSRGQRRRAPRRRRRRSPSRAAARPGQPRGARRLTSSTFAPGPPRGQRDQAQAADPDAPWQVRGQRGCDRDGDRQRPEPADQACAAQSGSDGDPEPEQQAGAKTRKAGSYGLPCTAPVLSTTTPTRPEQRRSDDAAGGRSPGPAPRITFSGRAVQAVENGGERGAPEIQLSR